jgi:hypothetical protein
MADAPELALCSGDQRMNALSQIAGRADCDESTWAPFVEEDEKCGAINSERISPLTALTRPLQLIGNYQFAEGVCRPILTLIRDAPTN